MQGLKIVGQFDQLIIGDGYPVLNQRFSGPIKITHFPKPIITTRRTGAREDRRVELGCAPSMYGYSRVIYPSPIYSDAPPMVFATPTGSADDKGLGLFSHIGSPGRWDGFSVLVTPSLFALNTTQPPLGFDSGWTYRVCVFGDPGNFSRTDSYGLRLFAEDGSLNFDSNWPIVPFRGQLAGWTRSSFTRHYNIFGYWGDRPVSGDEDYVLIKGTHPWGDHTGKLGLLLSAVGCIPLSHDVGDYNYAHAGVITVGFHGGVRDHIWAVAYEGASQHPAGDFSAMSAWNILTADFSYA